MTTSQCFKVLLQLVTFMRPYEKMTLPRFFRFDMAETIVVNTARNVFCYFVPLCKVGNQLNLGPSHCFLIYIYFLAR